MTPLPKRKHSKGRRNRRRAHYNLKPTTLEMCGQCKELKLPHRVCPTCGTYNGRQVIDVQAREERKGGTRTYRQGEANLALAGVRLNLKGAPTQPIPE
jgi:large subunit ribosomal protein L32